MMKRFKNKKGMIMVEAIVAMAVVIMVTLASLTVILSSAHTTQNAIYKSQAQYFAADAFACFRSADSTSQFVEAMVFRGGYTERQGSGNQYTFILNDSRFKAVTVVEYPADGRASFRIEILDKDDEVITSIDTFTKGD